MKIDAVNFSPQKKLPGNPLILVAPSGPTSSGSHHSKRMRYWSNQLSALGKIIPVLMHTVNNGSGVSIAQCLEHMIVAVKNKIVEVMAGKDCLFILCFISLGRIALFFSGFKLFFSFLYEELISNRNQEMF